jgi:DNA-binding response OmpR family regulator
VSQSNTTPLVVYVVDDEVVIADTVSEFLRSAGFQVLTFYDGAEVLLSRTDASPDVVVTDFAMPKCNGAALSIWLKERYPTCRIIMISGTPGAVQRHLSGQNLDFALLPKPFKLHQLGVLIEAEDRGKQLHLVTA